MKYKNFENQISEAFRQDSAAVDTDALLASLGIPVTVEKQGRSAWWILSALALLSLLLVGFYCYINGSNSSGIAAQELVLPKLSENTNNNNNNSKTAIAVSEENQENDQSYDEVELQSGESSSAATVNSSNSKNVSERNEKVSNDEVVKSTIRENIEIVNTESSPSYYSEQQNVVTYEQTETYSNTSSYTPQLNTFIDTKQEIKDRSVVNSVNQSRKVLEDIFALKLLKSELISEKEYPGLADPECPSFSYRIPWNFSLLAEVGVMKPMKELQNTNPAMDSVFALREMNENSKEAIQLGLHAKVSRGSNPLYVRGGLAYTRIAEQMTEEYDYTEQDTTRGVISITESMNGDTITRIYGDIISETRFTGRTVKHYFLHLWDLPIAVGYEMPVGGSYYVGGELGAQINFRTSGTGFVFRDVNDYADLSEVTSKETKVGMSYFGGLHFGKHLSKRSSIQVSARFRYYPSKFSTVDPNIEQRYNLAGLHAGYVFRF